MSGVMIIDVAEYARLKKSSGLWWTLLGFSCVLFMIIMFLLGVISDQYKMLDKVQKLEQNVMVTQEEQKIVNANFIKAWENQQRTAGLLIDWGSVIIDKNKIIEQNRGFASNARSPK